MVNQSDPRMVSKQNKNDPAVSLTKLTSLTPTPVRGGQSSIADFLRQDGGEEFQDWNGNVDDVDAPAAEVVGERKKSANLPIERVLYPHRYYEKQMEEMQTEETKIVLKNSSKPRPYTKSFPQLHIPVKQVRNIKKIKKRLLLVLQVLQVNGNYFT